MESDPTTRCAARVSNPGLLLPESDALPTELPGFQHASCPKNPSFICKSFFFHHYISVPCPKTQALSLYLFTIIFSYIVPKPKALSLCVFTIIFPYLVPKPKLYLYTFSPLYFRTLFQNPNFISQRFHRHIFVHCP